MTARRLIITIDEVVVDADAGVDLGALEAEVRSGIAAAFLAGTPPAFARSAGVLETAHAGVDGLGHALATATPPGRQP